jgi:hypothetical protein
LVNANNVTAESSQQQHTATGAPNRFAVTLIEKDKRHPWFGKGLVGRGHDIAFAVDGVPGQELTLVRGQTYEFEIRSNPLHDFYLTTSPVGRGRKVLVAGVEGNFTFDGTVKFTPTAITPDVVYYQCQNHTYMGGRIFIVDKAGQVPQRAAVEDEASEVIKEPEVDPQTLTKIVNNKITFAKLSVRSSSRAKRVKSSDHSKAQTMLRDADRMIAEAETTLQAGDTAKAQALIDEAIRISSSAFQMIPDTQEIKKRAKADYETLVRRVEASLASYQSYELTGKVKDSEKTKVDPITVQQDLITAQRLAKEEDYAAANKLLSAAQQSLDTAVAKILDAQTLTYELSFATPKDEYQYERNRNQEYNRLLATVVEKLNPPQAKMALITMLSKQGDDLLENAEQSATQGDFKAAIQTVQNSTARYQNAIQMAGVRLFGR